MVSIISKLPCLPFHRNWYIVMEDSTIVRMTLYGVNKFHTIKGAFQN